MPEIRSRSRSRLRAPRDGSVVEVLARDGQAVEAGQTLAALAWQEYGDSAEWRRIADENAVDNPRLIPAGTQLRGKGILIGYILEKIRQPNLAT